MARERGRLKKAGFHKRVEKLVAKTDLLIRQRQKIEKNWPALKDLVNQADLLLSEKGFLQKYTRISDDIRTRQIPWVSEKNRVPANIYVKFKLAGIKMTEKNLEALGLKEDTAALDKLIENY